LAPAVIVTPPTIATEGLMAAAEVIIRLGSSSDVRGRCVGSLFYLAVAQPM
jgi:hypothetical protein